MSGIVVGKKGERGALCEKERIVRMPLRAATERLETLQEEERAKGVQRRAEVAQDLDADFDRERDGPERLAELEPVVPLRGLGEVREPARLRPVELA